MGRDYRWVEKSSIIDIIRGEMNRQGNLSNEQIARVSAGSGVSESTLKNWFFGDTRKPLEISTRFVLEELGVRIDYVRNDGTTIRKAQDTMMSEAEKNKILKAERDRQREREKERDK